MHLIMRSIIVVVIVISLCGHGGVRVGPTTFFAFIRFRFDCVQLAAKSTFRRYVMTLASVFLSIRGLIERPDNLPSAISAATSICDINFSLAY